MIGQITADANGEGSLKLSTSPEGDEIAFPTGLVDSIDGTYGLSGDILQGVFSVVE